jgi:hypothetical protein
MLVFFHLHQDLNPSPLTHELLLTISSFILVELPPNFTAFLCGVQHMCLHKDFINVLVHLFEYKRILYNFLEREYYSPSFSLSHFQFISTTPYLRLSEAWSTRASAAGIFSGLCYKIKVQFSYGFSILDHLCLLRTLWQICMIWGNLWKICLFWEALYDNL